MKLHRSKSRASRRATSPASMACRHWRAGTAGEARGAAYSAERRYASPPRPAFYAALLDINAKSDGWRRHYRCRHRRCRNISLVSDTLKYRDKALMWRRHHYHSSNTMGDMTPAFTAANISGVRYSMMARRGPLKRDENARHRRYHLRYES